MTGRRFAIAGALLALALSACEGTGPTAPAGAHGAMLDSAYLSLLDGAPLPCCAVDSSGVRVRIVGGALTFYRSLHYTDSVFVPSGHMIPAACVREVPSGATVIGGTGLVKYPDGSIQIVLPCSLGEYDLTLIVERTGTESTRSTSIKLVSSGLFTENGDTLSLVDAGSPEPLAIATSDTTITVTTALHQYAFEMPCGAFCAFPGAIRR